MAVRCQLRPGDVLLAGWQEAGLLKLSAIKPVFATIEQSLVLRRLGILSLDGEALVRALVRRVLD